MTILPDVGFIFTYQEAIYLAEFYLSLGWTNPNHETANKFFKDVITWAEDYEQRFPEEMVHTHTPCERCECILSKTEWVVNGRMCPECNTLNRKCLIPRES